MSQQFPYKVVIDYIATPVRQNLLDSINNPINLREHTHALNTLVQFISSFKDINEIEYVTIDGHFTDELQDTLLTLVRDVCFPLIYHLQNSSDAENISKEKGRFLTLIIQLILTCAEYLEGKKLVPMISQLFIPLFSVQQNADSQVLKSKIEDFHIVLNKPLNERSCLELIAPLLSKQTLFIKFLNNVNDRNIWLQELFKVIFFISSEDEAFCKSFTVIAKIFSYCPKPLRKLCEDEVWDYYTQCHTRTMNIDHHWKCLYVFYCLKDYLFPVEETEKENVSSKLTTNNFWSIIQVGLLSQDPSHRKLSMYLIKRLVDTCDKNSCMINIPSGSQKLSDSDPLFWWSPSSKQQLNSTWENFFMLIETLEEKQVHVIKPLLPRMQKLIDASAVITSDGMTKYVTHVLLDVKYDGIELGMCSPVGQALKSFFNNLFSTLNKVQKVEFLRNFLQIVCDNSWGSIPLVFIFQGLSFISSDSFVDTELLRLFRQLLQSCLTCLEPVTRGAIQCFICKTILNLVDLSCTSVSELFSTLAFLNRDECLQRGTTTLWKFVVDWLKSKSISLLSQDKLVSSAVLDYLQANNEGENDSVVVDGYRVVGLARMLMLLADAEVESSQCTDEEVKKTLINSSFGKSLSEICAALKDLSSRAYLNTGKVKRCLSLTYSLVMEAGKSDNQVDDVIWKHLGELFHDVSYFVMTQLLDEQVKPDGTDEIEFYTDVLLCLGVRSHKLVSDIQVLLDFVSRIFSNSVKAGSNEQNLDVCDLHSTSAMKLLAVTLEKLKYHTQGFRLCPAEITSFIFGMTRISDVPIPFSRKRSSAEDFSKSQVGRLISFFISSKWKCQKFLLEHWLLFSEGDSKDRDYFDLTSLLNEAMEDTGIGSGPSDVEILQALETVIGQLCKNADADSLVKMLTLSWSNVVEEKKNIYFWKKIKAFIPVLFHVSLLEQNDSVIEQTVNELIEKLCLLGNARTGVMYLVFDHLCEVTLKKDTDRQIATKLIPLLVQGCYFGVLYKKGERVWLDVCSYIESLGPECSVNEITSSVSRNDLFTRLIVLNWLSTLRPDITTDRSFFVKFLELLKKNYLDLAALTTYKQFSNSLSHRQKHRMSLVFLLMADFINKEMCDDILPELWQALELECHPSVRQNIEWLVMMLLVRYPHKVSEIWDIFLMFDNKRSVCLCSLFLITCHLGPKLPEHIQPDYFKKALSTILPWTMAHHYNTRISAQAAVVRLWEQIHNLQLLDVQSEFFVLKESIRFLFNNSNASDTAHKLLSNYMYSGFDPVRDFSMETIFHTLPRLACIADEEWILPDYFIRKHANWQRENHLIPLHNSTDQLALCKKGPWRTKAQAENDDDIVESADGDVQKKIMPWRQMSPDQETEAELDLQRQKRAGHLVLVTSLIDKIPNLGGLCRTSEIFGVSEFVIGNLTHVEDRMFQNLSVSAQKWITITEVLKPKLSMYLEEKKLQGYTLVGVEQTANSVSLQDYKFPEKTLLILGNEREGIPVEIIQSLDVCVEIPQQGVIRSLNVHVCGALIVWEYTRQHMQNSQGMLHGSNCISQSQ
ncbi:hypothetical protein Btru_003171 [Bulinus truncatus]|nr:hypothetical protein Btru_003171 [Bulinus truncatus]